MKIHVRHGDGELVFPSFRDFQNMYRLKFVSPDDLVRRETSDRWIRARDLPELRALHLYDRSAPARHLVTGLWLLLGLISLGVMAQFVYVILAR